MFKFRYRYFWYFLLISLPLYKISLFNFLPRKIHLSLLGSALVVLGFFFFLFSSVAKVKLFRKNPIYIWLIIFNIFALLSVINPIFNGADGRLVDFFTYWIQVFTGSVLFFVSTQAKFKYSTLEYFIRLYIFLSVLVGCVGILEFLLGNVGGVILFKNYTRFGLMRATSIFKEPRHFGTFLTTPFVLLLWESLQRVRLFTISKKVKIFSLSVIVLAILTTFSSSAYIVSLVGAIFVFLLLPKKTVLYKEFLLSTIALFVIVAVFISLTPLETSTLLSPFRRFLLTEEEVKEIVRFQPEDISNIKRYDGAMKRISRGIIISIRNTIKHPFLGVGLNQYTSNIPVLYFPPFSLLQSIGILGFISFYLFAFKLFHVGFRLSYEFKKGFPKDFSLLLSIACILVAMAIIQNATSSHWNFPSVWFWAQLSLAGTIIFNFRRKWEFGRD